VSSGQQTGLVEGQSSSLRQAKFVQLASQAVRVPSAQHRSPDWQSSTPSHRAAAPGQTSPAAMQRGLGS
jgi:hypothetical protein